MLNRSRQAKVYLKFSAAYNVNYLQPSVLHSAMFVKFLGNSFTSPSSIKNYIAGAKTWISQHGGDPSSLISPVTIGVFKSILKSSSHVPSPAPPLTPHLLQIICEFCDSHPSVPKAFKPALLIGFTCMLQASNLLSPNLSAWGGSHTLLARDVLQFNHGLYILIRSSKTLSGPRPTVLEVRAVPSSSLCPLRAWQQYYDNVRPPLTGPAFLLQNGSPLTALPLVKLVRLALNRAGVPNSSQFSMHTLRRGAAQAADRMGAPIQDIMSQGTWASPNSAAHYLKPKTAVPRLLADLLAH